MKRFQLMQQVNTEGLYGTIQAALPHLKRERKGRIIVVSPPIYSRFFRGKTAYAMGKVGMSVLTKGLAMDFERQGLTEMAITSIWPAVVSDPVPPPGRKLILETQTDSPIGNRVCCHREVHQNEPGRSTRPKKVDHLLRHNLGNVGGTGVGG